MYSSLDAVRDVLDLSNPTPALLGAQDIAISLSQSTIDNFETLNGSITLASYDRICTDTNVFARQEEELRDCQFAQ